MVNRIVSVDETFSLPPEVRAALLDLLGAGSPGRPLAHVTYNPATQAAMSAPSTTHTALSPANLSVTFVAPTTGRVLVDLESHVNTSGGHSYWSLIDGSTVIAPTLVCGVVAEADGLRARARIPVTDLTPGQSYTLAWGGAASSGMVLRAGGSGLGPASSGPATITVWAAP